MRKNKRKTQQNMHEFVEMNQLGCSMIVNNLTSLFLLFLFSNRKTLRILNADFGQCTAPKYTQINTFVLHHRPNTIHAMSIFRSKCNRMQIKQTLDHFAIWKFILQNLVSHVPEYVCDAGVFFSSSMVFQMNLANCYCKHKTVPPNYIVRCIQRVTTFVRELQHWDWHMAL